VALNRPVVANTEGYFTYGQGRQLGGTPEENAKLATAVNWRASNNAKTILRTIVCCLSEQFCSVLEVLNCQKVYNGYETKTSDKSDKLK
jgi:hypothetical protein